MKKMTSNNDIAAVNVGRLLEKLEKEYSFISSVLDRVPLIYSQETDDSSDEDEIPKHANAVMSKCGSASRADTFEELQERLDALKSKKKPGLQDLNKKKNLKNKLKSKKKREDKNAGIHRMKQMEKAERRKEKIRNKVSSEKRLAEQKPSKPVFNSEGKMVFSKFDFSDIGSFNDTKKKKKEIKDPKKILEKLKQKKETLKKLKEEGNDEKVSRLLKKDAWSNALKKAEGIKVRDDPEMLMKSIKRQESKKKSSAKKWASRESTVEKMKKERIEKRESNLQARKDGKKQKKKTSAIKRGRVVVPGF